MSSSTWQRRTISERLNPASIAASLDAKIDSVESNLVAKINRLDTKLTKFEENEIDKRLQLEVRVSHIEKHIGIDKKISA
jgi:hypothetical protein